jgi:hypothetical protein
MTQPSYTITIVGSGKSIPVEANIVNPEDDYAILRRALSTISQGMPKAKIEAGKPNEQGVVELKVTPRLDGKGNGPDDYLRKCKGGRNPAIQYFLEINGMQVNLLDPHIRIAMGDVARKATQAGRKMQEDIQSALKALNRAPAKEVSFLVAGF